MNQKYLLIPSTLDLSNVIYFLISVVAHAFHASVTDIKLVEEKNSLQISSRIFLDDLEVALRNFSGEDKLNITLEKNRHQVDSLLAVYLLKKIKLKTGKGQMKLQYIGAEIEGIAIWCYLEVTKVKKLKSVAVTNNLLMEIFSDQQNIVHFQAYDKLKSECFDTNNEVKLFDWE